MVKVLLFVMLAAGFVSSFFELNAKLFIAIYTSFFCFFLLLGILLSQNPDWVIP